MSVSAHSIIVYGIKFDLVTSKYNHVFTRFDPKSGKPYEVNGKALHISLQIEDAAFVLPPDHVNSDKDSHNFTTWGWEEKNVRTRLYKLFLQHKIVNGECLSGDDLGYFVNGNQTSVVIGKEIQSSGDDNDFNEVDCGDGKRKEIEGLLRDNEFIQLFQGENGPDLTAALYVKTTLS